MKTLALITYYVTNDKTNKVFKVYVEPEDDEEFKDFFSEIKLHIVKEPNEKSKTN